MISWKNIYQILKFLYLGQVGQSQGDVCHDVKYSKFYRELVNDKLKTMIEEVCDELMGIGGGDDDDE